MKAKLGVLLLLMFSNLTMLFVSLPALSEKRTDFSGTWVFKPEKSKNVGMMAQMKLVQTIVQSTSSLEVRSEYNFQGGAQESKTIYDLTGKPTTNEAPMEGPSETVSKWDGDKLVTIWTSQGAVAGTKTVRTETRSLSADGKTMTVESVRRSNPSVVMVFERK